MKIKKPHQKSSAAECTCTIASLNSSQYVDEMDKYNY